MNVQTSRFGKIEIKDNEVITFSDGILGFESEKEFCVIDPNDQTLILWLQSTKNPEIAFPIIEPQIISPTTSIELLPNDLAKVKLESTSHASVYNILTIPGDISEISANLKAPIVINPDQNIGQQIVLQDNKLDLKHNVFKQLRAAITSMKTSSDKSTSQSSSIDRSKRNLVRVSRA